jgi:hypothetical protein
MKCILLATMLVVAAPPGWCVRNQERNDPLVQLRDAVEVKQSRVWLSDLLPPDASPALRKVSATIQLCSAPQPGSVRVLEGEQITARLDGQAEMLRQLAIPPRITVRYAGWPIAEERVRLAISEFLGQQVLHEARGRLELPDAARLEWSRPLTVKEQNPQLEVVGLDWDNRQKSIQVRLRCSTRASCGSFLVHVVFPRSIAEQWRQRLALGSDLNSPGDGTQSPATGDGAVLAEKGKPATLVLDDGSVRLSVRVICLQRGVLNQEIRVVEAKSRHVFHAEVVGAGLLHASL